MIQKIKDGVFFLNSELVEEKSLITSKIYKHKAKTLTMTYSILKEHNRSGDMQKLELAFDALAAHDMTYNGVLQTAIACGIDKFPIPFFLTNCHNSLCAVGGTLNEDDHLFGMSAAKKYGGILVPSHQAVIHQYIREMVAGCGKMVLGADSHTRYGALGTIAIGEGAGELVKQLLNQTYQLSYPEVILVYMEGTPRPGVGPQDVALSIIGSVFRDGFVKNAILEFCGPGISNIDVDFRNGIDVMMTESSALSTLWETDEAVHTYLSEHGREKDYKRLRPIDGAYYDSALSIDMSSIECMIALPFHPSNVYSIKELNENLEDILSLTEKKCSEQMAEFHLNVNLLSKIDKGRLHVSQGVVAGCAGGIYNNLVSVADILRGQSIGNGSFTLNVYPASQPILMEANRNGVSNDIIGAGANVRSAFCGPCFGAGDVPGNDGFSIRHTTRNFSSRDGSIPHMGQITSVALVDARSIAATAINSGMLTPATDIDINYVTRIYSFNKSVYDKRVLNLYKKSDSSVQLIYGPNIKPIPEMPALDEHLLLKISAYLTDPVTSTDDLLPGGESAPFRSNIEKLAEFTLSAKDPGYVERAKRVKESYCVLSESMGQTNELPELSQVACKLMKNAIFSEGMWKKTSVGSAICAIKQGDGSAREYAASCQKVLGGWANLSIEYATKRYRSNLINWGILPFLIDEPIATFDLNDYIFVPNVKRCLINKEEKFSAYLVGKNIKPITLSIGDLTDEERQILLDGCLINYYRKLRVH